MNQSNCPKCGVIIGEDAPQSLCPKCLLSAVASELATTPIENRNRRNTPLAPTVEELAPHFPELQIHAKLGTGGMGSVYKAYQQKLDRFTALKILSHDLASDPAFTERFNREARVLARLHHPNIVGVFDCGTSGPYCYLLMEYVDGVNLRQAMQVGHFKPEESIAVVEEICTALKFAHGEGILHRDIKPENILVDTRGRVKIADFGIAKLIGPEEPDHFTLTASGAVLGSPHYMAPEQIETPGEVDERADIYSLGVVFYELLTGELPIGRFAPPSMKRPMSEGIDEIVMRTLEKEREFRYQSVQEFQQQVNTLTKLDFSGWQSDGTIQLHGVRNRSARFASASMVLSLSSLLLAGLVISAYYVLESLANEAIRIGSSPGIVQNAYPIILAISMLAVGIPAGLGLFFGCNALREIRSAKGKKTGLARSIFGVLVWPIILILAATAGCVFWAWHRSHGALFFCILASAISLCLFAIARMVRSLSRWAKQDVKPML